ncbi:MAG: response regulator [Flavobacteriales bacterium]|nr:response regulator [Flavobacteriales bacterium]
MNINKEHIYRKRIEHLFSTIPTSLIANVTLATLLCYSFYNNADFLSILPWYISLIALMILRSILFFHFKKNKNITSEGLKQYEKYIFIGTLLNALLWGGYWSLMMPNNIIDAILVCFLVAGLCIGSIGTMAAHYKLFLSYNLVSCLPVFLSLLFTDFELSNTIATSGIIFLAAIASMGKQNNVLLINALELKEDNIEMNQKVSDSEKLALLKDEFLSNMSHEIRTPLNGIIGMLNILQKKLKLDKKEQDYFNILSSSSNQLLEIINDILDFSKLSSSSPDIISSNLNIKKLVSDIEGLFFGVAQEKNITITSHFKNTFPNYIISDETRLKQVLSNLIMNAIKFSSDGEIRMELEVIDIDQDDLHIKFSIIDHGIGIPKLELETLFEKFKQVDASSTKAHKGTGLGLAICQQIAELLNGKIGVESDEGYGSTFWFTIKCKIGRAEKEVMKKSRNVDVSYLKVLIVDDMEVNLTVAELMLENLECNCSSASSGKEAIELALNNNFDVILMDIQMPNLNGIQTLEALREKNIKCPIIALTANAMPGDKEEYLEKGFNDYIPKPVNTSLLARVLAKWKPI